MENGNKPVLRLDFADALGVQKKNDNFLHNILARHYDVQIVDTPDLLIFTHYGHRNRLYSCKKSSIRRSGIFLIGKTVMRR